MSTNSCNMLKSADFFSKILNILLGDIHKLCCTKSWFFDIPSVLIAKVVFLIMVQKTMSYFGKQSLPPTQWFIFSKLQLRRKQVIVIEAQKIPALQLWNYFWFLKWQLKMLFEINFNWQKYRCCILLNGPPVYIVKVVLWQIVHPSLLAT